MAPHNNTDTLLRHGRGPPRLTAGSTPTKLLHLNLMYTDCQLSIVRSGFVARYINAPSLPSAVIIVVVVVFTIVAIGFRRAPHRAHPSSHFSAIYFTGESVPTRTLSASLIFNRALVAT